MTSRKVVLGTVAATVTLAAAACASAASTTARRENPVGSPTTASSTSPAISTSPASAAAAPVSSRIAVADPLKYADISTVMTDPPSDKPMNWVPHSAARDTAVVLAHLDPSHGHLRALKANAGNGDHVLPDNDPQSRSTTRVALDALWTVDGVTPQVQSHTLSGTVQVYFGSDPAQLGLGGLDTPPGSPLPCGYGVRDLGLVSGPAPAWSTCVTKTLGDGSRLSTASAQFGPGTLTVAFREFPQGHGGIAIYATDYPPVGTATTPGPEPAVVLSPSPFTPSALADALSDPALTPGLTRIGAAE